MFFYTTVLVGRAHPYGRWPVDAVPIRSLGGLVLTLPVVARAAQKLLIDASAEVEFAAAVPAGPAAGLLGALAEEATS